jgi:hypothetical protein
MTSLIAVSGRRVVLVSALLAFACQKDGDAVFDNANLSDPVTGSSGSGGSGAGSSLGGDVSTAGSSTAGSSSEAGETGSGAQGGSGNGGSDGGSSTAGSAGTGEEGGSAGNPAAGMAGHAGTKPDPTPEPVTVLITEFEDAHVVSCDAYDSHGTAASIIVDADQNDCVYQGLLRPLLESIPEGAQVSDASLTLYCIDDGSAVGVSYVAEAWKESTVTWNNRPSAGSSLGSVGCQALGPVTIDLTDAVQSWLGGESPYGIYFRGEETNGIDFASSEAENAETRPQLSITYVLPVK